MPNFSGLSSFLDNLMIAMEADDITQQTANEVRSAIGGASSLVGTGHYIKNKEMYHNE